jgi:putative cardiolipin synthase
VSPDDERAFKIKLWQHLFQRHTDLMNLRKHTIPLLLVAAGLVFGCSTVPLNQPKSLTTCITEVDETRLGRIAADWTAENQGLSGFYPLSRGMDALGVRLKLAERAEKSIDLQYFLMKDDTAGFVMTNALLQAADRGVRVRFLIDDIFTTVPDRVFLLLDQHPNIEIRIFNPISRRGISKLNLVWNFRQANRRMHNKSFTVDNSFSVVGGRNIADVYFELNTAALFADLDVVVLGPVVKDISASFDEYWKHKLAVPVKQFTSISKKYRLEKVRKDFADKQDNLFESVYKEALDSHLLQDLITKRLPLYAAPARVLADSPAKLTNTIGDGDVLMAPKVLDIFRNAEREVICITPYYVPGTNGVQFIQDLTNKGVRVIIITNSLASTNHIPVHSAYARYRKAVLEAGAKLYETRANAVTMLTGNGDGPDMLTLHTKAFFIDGEQLFIGSMNLDPRSIEINAEMGLLIDSEPMLERLAASTKELLPNIAYEVRINKKGQLEWHGRIDNQSVIETKEPLTSRWRRFKAWCMKIVPESQL